MSSLSLMTKTVLSHGRRRNQRVALCPKLSQPRGATTLVGRGGRWKSTASDDKQDQELRISAKEWKDKIKPKFDPLTTELKNFETNCATALKNFETNFETELKNFETAFKKKVLLHGRRNQRAAVLPKLPPPATPVAARCVGHRRRWKSTTSGGKKDKELRITVKEFEDKMAELENKITTWAIKMEISMNNLDLTMYALGVGGLMITLFFAS